MGGWVSDGSAMFGYLVEHNASLLLWTWICTKPNRFGLPVDCSRNTCQLYIHANDNSLAKSHLP